MVGLIMGPSCGYQHQRQQEIVSLERAAFPRKISGRSLNSQGGCWSIDIEWAEPCKDDPRTTEPLWTAQSTKIQDMQLQLIN